MSDENDTTEVENHPAASGDEATRRTVGPAGIVTLIGVSVAAVTGVVLLAESGDDAPTPADAGEFCRAVEALPSPTAGEPGDGFEAYADGLRSAAGVAPTADARDAARTLAELYDQLADAESADVESGVGDPLRQAEIDTDDGVERAAATFGASIDDHCVVDDDEQ